MNRSTAKVRMHLATKPNSTVKPHPVSRRMMLRIAAFGLQRRRVDHDRLAFAQARRDEGSSDGMLMAKPTG